MLTGYIGYPPSFVIVGIPVIFIAFFVVANRNKCIAGFVFNRDISYAMKLSSNLV
jgi:hypothetical protein